MKIMVDYFASMKTQNDDIVKRPDLEEMKDIFSSMLDTYDSSKTHEEKMDCFSNQEKRLDNFLERYGKNAR